MPAPEKIAILGGGVGAMSAAFALTNQPGWERKYDITVYQMGWRLGGKGASGRNRDKHNRIEEHGLHIWMGMYENAFHLMQDCYAALGRDPMTDPLATWDAAFKKHSFCTMMEPTNGTWAPWSFNIPTNDAVPGAGGVCLSIGHLIGRILQWVFGTHAASPFAGVEDGLTDLAAARAEFAAIEAPIELMPHEARTSLLRHLEAYRQKRHAALFGTGTSWLTSLRRNWILLDLGITLIRGLLVDRITTSFDPLDRYDFREWLTLHGASAVSVWSAPIRCIYELVFAYAKGDPNVPRLGAGVALRFVLRSIFTYQGAFIYFMQAGMGDVVFVPLYAVLKNRGVKFKFFHRVDDLGLDASGHYVDTIQMSRQATMKAGDYQPLVPIAIAGYANPLPCWPATPLADQFVDVERTDYLSYQSRDIEVFESAWSPWTHLHPLTLRRGADFDRVVLGISLGALKYVCPQLVAASPAWQNMVARVQTVQTQSFQVWLNRTADDMGWTNVPEPAILDSYRNSWADFSHLIGVENWGASHNVRNIAYFCNAFQEAANVPDPSTDPTFPIGQMRRARDNSLNYLKTGLTAPLWPDALNPSNPNELDWNALVDPTGASGPARFDYQFWRANIDPTERYVQSVPNSTQYRLKADESGFANLVLAGDWLKTGINAGCVEAAVMGGLQASRAIGGYPAVVFGEKDFCSSGLAAVQGGAAAYVSRGGEQVPCQPASLKGADVYSFMLPSNVAALQRLCDTYLNLPGQNQVRYEAFLPRVLLTMTYVSRVQSLTPPDDAKGWSSESDAAFWVPILALDQSGWSLPRLVWFQPYLFVDNAWTVAAGRETYGFAKEAATFPRAAGPQFSANALAIVRFGSNVRAVDTKLIEVRRGNGAGAGEAPRTFASLDDALRSFVEALVGPGDGRATELASLLSRTQVSFVFLKEFRDAADGKQACYQAIVEAPATVDHVAGLGTAPGPYVVTVTQADSHPMIDELGLPRSGAASADTDLPVNSAWRLQFDFTIGNGRIIWQA